MLDLWFWRVGFFSCGMWTLSCGMWNLVPQPRMEPRPPALETWSLSHWTTREVPGKMIFNNIFWLTQYFKIQSFLFLINIKQLLLRYFTFLFHTKFSKTSAHFIANVHAKSLQSCPTLYDSMDYSPPGSSVYRILQARILEWVAMLSSRIYLYLECIPIHISYILWPT